MNTDSSDVINTYQRNSLGRAEGRAFHLQSEGESEYLKKQFTDRTKRHKELRETFQLSIGIKKLYIRHKDRL